MSVSVCCGNAEPRVSGETYRYAKLFGDCVDARVLQQLLALGVNLRQGRVFLQGSFATFADAAREVFAGVEVFEEGSDSLEVLFGQLEQSAWAGFGAALLEVGRLGEEVLMG